MRSLCKRSTMSILLAAAGLLIAACSKSTTQPTKTTVEGQTSTAPSVAAAKKEHQSLVRFINTTQSPKDLFYQDMAAFTNVPFEAVTPYTELPSGHPDAHELMLYNASNDVGTPLTRNSDFENVDRIIGGPHSTPSTHLANS